MINLRKGLSGRTKRRKAITALLVLVACLCAFYPPLMAAPKRVSSVELAGVAGAANNVAFAFDRYAFVAPYAPSAPVTRVDDPTELDNHFLYLIDTKKANFAIPPKDLTAFSSGPGLPKTVYYPTKIKFDPNTSNVYVRGTSFERSEDGIIEEKEVLAYVHVNLDDNGKPFFDSSVVIIDIKGIGEDYCREAPTDFVLAHNGSLVVFTNGASVFTYNVNKGYVYNVDIVPPNEYSDASSIVHLDIDEATNLLTIVWNKPLKKDDNSEINSTELSFYQVKEDGVLPLVNRVYAEAFPAGSFVSEGSNVVIASSLSEAGQLESAGAYFVSNNGELCSVDLLSKDVVTTVRTHQVFPELAQGDAPEAGPRTISYDSSARVFVLVKNGVKAQIRKLINGRPGRRGTVVRTFSAESKVEEPALALVRFNKRGKVVSTAAFTETFRDGVGLSNIDRAEGGQWLVASRAGKLYSIRASADLEKAAPEEVGEIGERIDHIDYLASRSSVVAINSYSAGDEGTSIEAPGSIVVASVEAGDPSISSNIQNGLSQLSAFAAAVPRIRRPCNVRR